MAARKPSGGPDERVKRALTGVRSAVSRLVGFLGDDDPEVVERAAVALEEVGEFAVGPLAAALCHAPSADHRAVVVAALTALAPGAEVPVLRALARAAKLDPDPFVKAAAGQAYSSLLVAGIGRGATAARGSAD